MHCDLNLFGFEIRVKSNYFIEERILNYNEYVKLHSRKAIHFKATCDGQRDAGETESLYSGHEYNRQHFE